MITRHRLCSPVKRLLNKLNSIHTFVNHNKTHTVATHFGGIGDNLVEDSRNQEHDTTSEGESQEEYPFKQIPSETAYIRQFVEEKVNEPREAIHKIEERLNDLTLALQHQNTPLENVLDRYTETLCTAQKKTSLESSLFQDIPILNGQDSSQLED